MKIVIGLLCAFPLALYLLYSFRRGSTVRAGVFNQPCFSYALRVVAILVVFVGAAGESRAQRKGTKASPVSEAAGATVMTDATIQKWLALKKSLARTDFFRRMLAGFSSHKPVEEAERLRIRRAGRGLPASYLLLLDSELSDTGTIPAKGYAAGLLSVIKKLDAQGCYFPAINASLFAMTQHLSKRAPEKTAIYSALCRRITLSDALIVAASQVRPIELPPQAWASKAGPSRFLRRAEVKVRGEILAHLSSWMKKEREHSWRTVGATSLVFKSGNASLIRAGRKSELAADSVVTLGRLDQLDCDDDAVFHHAWLGILSLKKGQTFDSWTLPDLMSGEQQGQIRTVLNRALIGDRVSLGLLELSLPLTRPFLEQAVRNPVASRKPDAALLLILSNYYSLTFRPLPAVKVEKRPFPTSGK